MADLEDKGMSAHELRIAAWLLAVVALMACVRYTVLAGSDELDEHRTQLAAFLVLGAAATVAAAASAVLAGVKNAERRLALGRSSSTAS